MSILAIGLGIAKPRTQEGDDGEDATMVVVGLR
jgi:hypothetical protein